MPAATKDVVIALDQGSSSSRALAFDSRGNVVARAQFPVKTFYPRPGWSEQEPADLVRSQERALDAVLDRIPKSWNILGVGIASQRSTIVLWDSSTGKPVCRALTWQDGRAAESVSKLHEYRSRVFERSGLYLTPYYSAPKIRWLIDHMPVVRNAYHAGRLKAAPVASYLVWKLTKGEVLAADPSLAQRTLLFNSKALDWDPNLLQLFDLSPDMLPEVRPSASDFGAIERRGRRLPILAVLGDQQAAALGLKANKPGSSVINYGTGAFLLVHSGADDRRVPGILSSVAWQRRDEPCEYFLEATIHAVGTSFQWLKDNMGMLKDSHDVDSACRRSKNRILALQAIGGLGAPRWDYSTFTSYTGINSRTTRDDIVRGATESIAYMIADAAQAVRNAGVRMTSVMASGGVSRVDHLVQFQSNLLQIPLMRMKESETTAAGAATLAAESAGAPWAGAIRKCRVERRFVPKIKRDEAERLLQGWKFFVETQQKLSSGLRKLGVLPSA